jgi:hypothetical protein
MLDQHLFCSIFAVVTNDPVFEIGVIVSPVLLFQERLVDPPVATA